MLENHIIGTQRLRVGKDRRAIIKLREGTNTNWYAVRGDFDKYKIIALVPEDYYLAHKDEFYEWKKQSRTQETPDVPLVFDGNKMHLSRFYKKLIGAADHILLIGVGNCYNIWKPEDFENFEKEFSLNIEDISDYLARDDENQIKKENPANKSNPKDYKLAA